MIKDTVKMVVFDMAGTTIDEGKTVYKCVRDALSEYGFEFTLEDVMSRIGGMNKKEGIALLMKSEDENITDEAIEVVFNSFIGNVEDAYKAADDLTEIEGTTEFFEFLKANNIKVVLDTGYFRTTADILIDKMGWAKNQLIDFSVTSDEVQSGRPAPFMIEKAKAHFQIAESSQVAKVGDTASDIAEGKNAGCLVIVGVSSDMYSKADLIDMGASHAVDSLKELKEIFETE